ncbi:xylulokinase [Deinococcus deserti]|uniref:Xylulose kinase n=1 Tax=Deinococcus deserti (strain DSM 17065 / CIP 109153 / LMG 22923 / VCD115) TaxID=546414 RepID=C1CZT9_DEIDV|nr:xylulokinase [Deinococcus deserti]ACO45191.1 putative Xylulose kinase (Xylulokinase) [Deinococcus deserti VCD115]
MSESAEVRSVSSGGPAGPGEPVTLGIDLGTSGVKVVALDATRRTVVSVTREYPLLTPQPGWTEQRPEDWVAATLSALGEVAGQLSETGHTPLALGLSGQMHGAVFLDAHGEVLRPAPLWNDQRTARQVQDIEARVPLTDLIARTGNRAVTGFQLPKVLWLKSAEPEVFARLAHVLLPKDYLGYALTGVLASEPSDASGVGALNLARLEWDADILSALGLAATLFPEVRPSTARVGTLHSSLAAVTGLPAGLPVVAGGGDNAAAAVALGLGSAQPEIGSVSLGTSGVLFAPLSSPTPDPRGRVHLFAHADGGYHLLGVTLACAGALQWLRDRLCPEVSFETLLREAEKAVPSEENVLFLPFLAGERSPHMRSDLRAAWLNLSLAHSRGHLVRAVLEGTAFALAETHDVMRQHTQLQSLLATGGGARSDLWLGLMAQGLDLDIYRTASTAGAAEGAALLAMPEAGLYASLQEAMGTASLAGLPVPRVPSHAPRTAYSAAFQRLYG